MSFVGKSTVRVSAEVQSPFARIVNAIRLYQELTLSAGEPHARRGGLNLPINLDPTYVLDESSMALRILEVMREMNRHIPKVQKPTVNTISSAFQVSAAR